MSIAPPNRQRLLDSLSRDMGRDMSAAVLHFHQSVADQVGLNAADLKSFDLVQRFGPLTAGRMAELTGLSTGAITSVIDRLEDAGFVTRSRDEHDRRRVIVEVVADGKQLEVARHYEEMCEAWTTLLETYDDRELVLIHDFLERSIAMLQLETVARRAVG